MAGVAEGGNISTVKGRYGDSTEYIHFRVGPHVVSYASKQKGFNRVVYAVKNRKEISIGVSTERETLLPRKGWVPLYEVSVGDDVILTYEDTVRDSYRSFNSVFCIGAVLLMAFGWCLHRCYTNRNLPFS